MRKKFLGFLAACLALVTVGGFAACGEDEQQSSLQSSSVSVEESSSADSSKQESSSDNTHVHIWGKWQDNGEAHWKECYCGERTGGGAHSESEWIVDKVATCTAIGEKHTECDVCKVTMQTGIVNKLAHNYVDEWKLEEDAHYKACEACGDRIEEDVHTFTDRQPCSVCQTPYYTMGLRYEGSILKGDSTAMDTTDIVIPAVYNGNAVTSIGNNAFAGLGGLKSIEIPDSVTSIGGYAFFSCSSLTSIEIPDSVTSIGEWAFSGCSSLTSLVIPDSVTSIGAGAFSWGSSLTSIEIPDSVTSIGDSAFSGCGGLTGVYITDMAAWYAIDFGGYYSNPLSYADNLYLNNQLVTELVIPDGVTYIGSYAFSGCSSLTSVVIPDSVTSIGGGAFERCSSLTTIEIPDSVTSIGADAFSGCSSLTSIKIPDSVTSIGERTFSNCESLTNIIVNENNANYQSIDGNLYTKDGATLIQYAIGKTETEFIISDSVTSIADSAFSGCSNLTIVKMPNSVTIIGNYVFNNCIGLTSIVISDGLTSIGGYVFARCGNLTNIEIPDSVTVIGHGAFDSCDALTSVIIGNGVTYIGERVFDDCRCLTSITFEGTVAQWNAIEKDNRWNSNVPATEVVCSDGKVSL